MPPSAIAWRISVIRPKCRRNYRIDFIHSIRRAHLQAVHSLLLSAVVLTEAYRLQAHQLVHLKEDLRKLSEQVRYMDKYGIETLDDLYADREKIQRYIDCLITRRTKLQNKIRRDTSAEKETLRQKKKTQRRRRDAR